MKSLKILWQFSRPHTIIGSTLSILSIFAIAIGTTDWIFIDPLLLPLSLLTALTCNIYITGLNQWSDIEVDKINKPWLPIAAGTLSKDNALRIVLVCGIISLAAADFILCLPVQLHFFIFCSTCKIQYSYRQYHLRFSCNRYGIDSHI